MPPAVDGNGLCAIWNTGADAEMADAEEPLPRGRNGGLSILRILVMAKLNQEVDISPPVGDFHFYPGTVPAKQVQQQSQSPLEYPQQ